MILNGLPWKRTEIILLFLRLYPSAAFQTLVDYDDYSISSKGFLPTVVDIMVIELNSPIPVHFSLLIPKNVDDHSCHFLFDHFQFALIHGPIIPGSYAILLFTAWNFTSITSLTTTGCCFCFGSVSSFFLELFLH